MFIPCFKFIRQKCVHVHVVHSCVCVCMRVCVCVRLPSLTVHDCLLSDFVCFIYFPSSLFTSQSDIHPAYVYTDLNTHVICVCVCVCAVICDHVCVFEVRGRLYSCLQVCAVRVRVRVVTAHFVLCLGLFACVCVWVCKCCGSLCSIAVLRLPSRWCFSLHSLNSADSSDSNTPPSSCTQPPHSRCLLFASVWIVTGVPIYKAVSQQICWINWIFLMLGFCIMR